MSFRKPLVTALAAILVGGTMTVPTGAHGTNFNHTMYVTFSRPVALPGVTLGTGTYIFEVPEATGDHDLVRVSSKDRSIVYLTAFTRTVNKPAGMKRNQVISLAEAAANRIPAVEAWWPEDSMGRQFIYTN